METDWSENLTVGVEKIDRQHQEIFKRISTLRAALREGDARSEVERTLEFLEKYVTEHFSMEETYMRRFSYHGILAHRSEHEGFIRDFIEFKRKWKDLNARNEITSFLELQMARRFSGWLTEHIAKVDKELGAFLDDKI